VTDDRELLVRARSGDLDAFAELVRRHERRVRSVLARLLDDERDVEEAAQDVFVQAWRGLDAFRGEASASTWLYRIAVNAALMRRRRRRVETTELEEAPAREVPDRDLQRFLAERIRALDFEYRAPLVLRDVSGLSNEEVAAALGLSVAAAKSRIHRARMQIRAELEAWQRGD
jgi:RNA polymerase sigma-70 factor (ECF subfamily)